MRRDFGRLASGPFDLLIIGGGIYGAWTACDAARRGLRVALVERGDWASGTSSASSKLLHGGIRYLEGLHLRLVRTSLSERARLASIAPHQVRPVRFLLPVYRGDRVGRLRLMAGLTLYDALGGRRPPARAHESLSPEALAARAGFLKRDELSGGFTYGDCVMDDARLALEVVAAACEAGCAAVNGAEAGPLLLEEGRVRGARVRDTGSGESFDVLASATICCAGAWSGRLLDGIPASRPAVRISRGVHLVMPALPTRDACLLQTRADQRVIFLIPWYGRTLLGTTDVEESGDPDAVEPAPADVDYLLTEANRFLAGSPWSRRVVAGSFAGLRVLRERPGLAASALGREWSVEAPLPGLLLPVGGKFTSARADAAKLVDRALAILGRPGLPCATADRPLPWSPRGELSGWLAGAIAKGRDAGLDDFEAETVARRFGSRLGDLIDLVRADPRLARRIHPELPFCRAEAVLAAREEMVRNLDDLARRRIPLSILARLDSATAGDLADLAGDVLGWSDEQRREEAAGLLAGGHGVLAGGSGSPRSTAGAPSATAADVPDRDATRTRARG